MHLIVVLQEWPVHTTMLVLGPQRVVRQAVTDTMTTSMTPLMTAVQSRAPPLRLLIRKMGSTVIAATVNSLVIQM